MKRFFIRVFLSIYPLFVALLIVTGFFLILPRASAITSVSTTSYKTTGATALVQADCNEVTFSPDSGKKFISCVVLNSGSTNNLLVKFSNTANNAFPIPPQQNISFDSEFIANSVITYCSGVSTTSYVIICTQASGQ